MISESLLNAILHLFAMQVSRMSGPSREAANRRVRAYLNHHVGLSNAETHMGLFDALAEIHQAEGDEVLLAQAVPIAERLNSLLHGFERHAAVLRFVELSRNSSEQELPRKIARVLATKLELSKTFINDLFDFLQDPVHCARTHSACRIFEEGFHSFHSRFAALRVEEEQILLVSSVAGDVLRVEGRPLGAGECQPLRPGHVMRDAWGNELVYSQVAHAFGERVKEACNISFCGTHLNFRFPGSENGLHDFSFSEHSGRMVAIMGGSGAGKSTLMSILNGTLRPDSGELRINGLNVYTQAKRVEGVIGFVPQDDLLFEDLTVFENLYYAARLCLSHLSEDQLVGRVNGLLSDLGQSEVATLKVGSPLNQSISGGQRKRLNIALELIREPTILFVDEPTSGLSSADSDMVMRLLKAQAELGKLVFVVIHQPSSKIFRSFDALWVLDQGGWPIYSGTPLEAMGYFRSRGGLPGEEEAICAGCGGVNPEQLFEIMEDKLVDPAGVPTRERRVAPQEWNRLFQEYSAQRKSGAIVQENTDVPSTNLHRPGRVGQWMIFLARDVRARLANAAYLAIAIFEPLILGLLIGVVSRGALGGVYSFHENNNVHIFFFMSVMVALFLGLSVSAEEICRDGRILRRERFLHLSWWSYVNSKTFYLAMVAGIQSLLYIGVALPLVQVPGLFFKMWIMLFACAFSSSLLGLNISASFRSAITIYILIPLLLIPQMLLCGVVIPYDDLIAPTSIRREVPAYANWLPPRWAYEALVVEQFSQNEYMRTLSATDARIRLAEHELDFFLPELQSRVQSIPLLNTPESASHLAEQLRILQLELRRLETKTGLPLSLGESDFQPSAFPAVAGRAAQYIAEARRFYFEQRRVAAAEKRELLNAMETVHGKEGVDRIRKRHTNRAIQDQVLNLRDMEPVRPTKDGLYSTTLPIYRLPESSWGGAHFLAGSKRVGHRLISTWNYNLAAIFFLSLLLYGALCVRLLPHLLHFGHLFSSGGKKFSTVWKTLHSIFHRWKN